MASLLLPPDRTAPRPSYAEVARTPPTSQPSNVQTLSTGGTTPSTFTSTLYCTIDTSRVEGEASDQVSAGAIRTMVETGVRTEQGKPSWRCRAVTKSPKNPHRIRLPAETRKNTRREASGGSKAGTRCTDPSRRPLPHQSRRPSTARQSWTRRATFEPEPPRPSARKTTPRSQR